MSNTNNLNCFRVGGFVRDTLLGREPKDCDWVVVGTTVQDMLDRGFRLIGQSFPVFLHSESNDEYALARTERKTAPGYQGFQVQASPDVTLEQDLSRRDLTINAMAITRDGEIIDPFGGVEHLKKGLLQHVSNAFSEDPVRILRIARFAARFDFNVSPETLWLMKSMVTAGEVDALTPERVWAELWKTLSDEPVPSRFFEVLQACGALRILFPEVDALFGVPQTEKHHPEIDTGIHTMMVLDAAARMTDDPVTRFAALTHDLGKSLTPVEMLPRHIGHEEAGVPLVAALCERYKAPAACRMLGQKVSELHLNCHRAFELRPSTILRLFSSLDGFRNPENIERFLIACTADAKGRLGFEDKPYPQADFLREAFSAAAAVSAKDVVAAGVTGPKVGEAIQRKRVTVIKAIARPAK